MNPQEITSRTPNTVTHKQQPVRVDNKEKANVHCLDPPTLDPQKRKQKIEECGDNVDVIRWTDADKLFCWFDIQ